MKNLKLGGRQLTAGFLIALLMVGVLGNTGALQWGATNFDRIVLGSGNYETDPNITADITLQNDEYITNGTDGTIDFGAANLLTTGNASITGNITDALGYRYSGFLTVATTDATELADTLKLASTKYALIKVRIAGSGADSVHVATGLLANQLYIFKAVHTDSSVVFVDGGNLILGGTRTLDGDDDILVCFSDGTSLIEVAFANNE